LRTVDLGSVAQRHAKEADRQRARAVVAERELARHRARADAAERELVRLRVAAKYGLPAGLLVGDTEDAIRDHAARLAAFRLAGATRR
jgi:hypothetical protein